MAGLEMAVEQSINEPIGIYADPEHPTTNVFYRPVPAAGPLQGGFIRVAVDYRHRPGGEATGSVRTAFWVAAPKGRERIIWPS
jgi:hypothetical protein